MESNSLPNTSIIPCGNGFSLPITDAQVKALHAIRTKQPQTDWKRFQVLVKTHGWKISCLADLTEAQAKVLLSELGL